jgi:putative transposase
MRFVDEHSHRFAVALLLRVLDIAESTYYQWVKQAEQPCDRDLVDLGLISNIHEIWEASGRTYGADRVHRQLRRDGVRVGRKRVERLMAGQGWQGAFLRRGWRGGSTKQDPKATPAPLCQAGVRHPGDRGWLVGRDWRCVREQQQAAVRAERVRAGRSGPTSGPA